MSGPGQVQAICEHLFHLFEECLNERPHLWMEFAYTRPTDWRVVVWDRTGGVEKTLVDAESPVRQVASTKAAIALHHSRTLDWRPADQWDAVHEKLAGSLKIAAWHPLPNGGIGTGQIKAGVSIIHTPTGLECVSAKYLHQSKNRDAALREMIRMLRNRGVL